MTAAGRARDHSLADRAENALLLAVARYPQPEQVEIGADHDLDWDYLTQAAARQGLSPLLYRWIEKHPRLVVPDAARTALHSAYWVAHFRNRALLREFGRILRAAVTQGVAVMPLKGALLASRYYPQAALRPMSDLDLLVRPEDFERLAAILRSLGYHETLGPPYLLDERFRDPIRQERAFASERQGMTLLVEYRTEALDPMVWHLTDLDPVLTAGLLRHAERTWARARRDTFPDASGEQFARMAVEDLLLHLASHLTARHADYRLLWLHDICRVTAAHPAIDWAYLAREARALNLSAPVFSALQAARRWVGAPIPLARVRREFFGPRFPRPALEVAERIALLRRVRALGASDLAAPPPGEIAIQVGSLVRLNGGLPWLRALRWIIAPGKSYAAGWRGGRSSIGYAVTLVLRAVILLLHGCGVIFARLSLVRVAESLGRIAVGIERAARIDSFAIYATKRDGDVEPRHL